MAAEPETVTLWRPTGPRELELVAKTGYRRWPPRLPDQPIFYPVLNEEYARKIARDWNVPASGVGYVTRFSVRRELTATRFNKSAGERSLSTGFRPKTSMRSTTASSD